LWAAVVDPMWTFTPAIVLGSDVDACRGQLSWVNALSSDVGDFVGSDVGECHWLQCGSIS